MSQTNEREITKVNEQLLERFAAIYDELDAITTDPDYTTKEVRAGLSNLVADVTASVNAMADKP